MKPYPPAAEMSPDDLLDLCAKAGRDPAQSYDLAGSCDHIEAVCRLAVSLAQDLSTRTEEHDQLKRDERRNLNHIARAEAFVGELHAELVDMDTAKLAAERDNRALQERLAALTNERDRLVADLAAAHQALAAREDEIARTNNLRQLHVIGGAM